VANVEVLASTEVQNRALRRAAELLGGPEELAKHLGVPQSYVRVWLRGKPIPATVFLRTVDIISDYEVEAVKAAASSQRRRQA
jgi:hypothetical protein